jgi:O-antigen/teichoic acid export membrane protein
VSDDVRPGTAPHTPLIEIELPLAITRTAIPSLRVSFAWTLAANLSYAGCQWCMLSVLAKLGSPSIVGQFTLGLALSAPVFMFTNLQLRSVQATDTCSEFRFPDYFMLRLLATLVGLAAIIAIVTLTRSSPAVRVATCVECMSDVTAGLLQREEQLKRVSISLMIRGGGAALLFSLTFFRYHNLALSVAAMSAVWFAVLAFYDIPNAKSLITVNQRFFRFDSPALRRLLRLSFPLGLVGAIGSLNIYIPRYLLQHYMGSADQGIYSSLAYLVVAIGLVVLALSQSSTTRLARLFADGELNHFIRLLLRLSMVGVLMAVVGVPLTFLVGRSLLTLLYRSEYADHVGLLALFVGTSGATTLGTFLFCGISAARLFRAQVPVYCMAALTGTVGSVILIPRRGLIGAGISLLLSAMVTVCGGLLVLHSALTTRNCEGRVSGVGESPSLSWRLFKR